MGGMKKAAESARQFWNEPSRASGSSFQRVPYTHCCFVRPVACKCTFWWRYARCWTATSYAEEPDTVAHTVSDLGGSCALSAGLRMYAAREGGIHTQTRA